VDLFTIGYEAATLPDVVARLQSAGVQQLIDVRAIAASRRPGFSKTVLSATLNEAGIDYLHLRALGTPADGRAAARAGRTAEMRRIFAAHMEEPAAQLALLHAAEAVAARPSALLCYERDAAVCHRAVLAGLLAERLGCAIHDL
jgi:uncharacterized protein (DUF488 family)